MVEREAYTILAVGARLDAWAAKVSRRLAKSFPEHALGFEANTKDELAHAYALASACGELDPQVDETAVVKMAKGALTTNPIFNLIYLNLFERRSERTFRLVASAFPQFRETLRDIAADENRHVAFGLEILRSLNEPLYIQTLTQTAAKWITDVDASDTTVTPDVLKRLRVLNHNCAHTLLRDL